MAIDVSPKTIVADPPWHTPASGRCSPHRHFAHLSDDRICTFLLDEDLLERTAKAEHLYLWAVTTKVDTAFEVCRAWDFQPCSVLVWVKADPNKCPVRLQIGLGRNFRVAHELCIFARRGKKQANNWRREPTVFFAPRGRIAGKPDAFYDMVERQSDPPYLELFARRRRLGWRCVGDQLD